MWGYPPQSEFSAIFFSFFLLKEPQKTFPLTCLLLCLESELSGFLFLRYFKMEGSHLARRGASPSAGRSRHHPGVVGCLGCPEQGLIDFVEEENYVPGGNTLVKENMIFLHQVIF